MSGKIVDGPSYKGQFGWEKIGTSELAVPVIVRSNGIRYSPVRIVEQEIIKKYDSLPPSVFSCITLKSFYLTAVEAKLLNEINYNHCQQRYGETYFGVKDVIISASDVKELSRYLNISLEIYSKDISKVGPHFGIIDLITDPRNLNCSMYVPFITKLCGNLLSRYVPYKVIEPFVRISPTTIQSPPNDWDIMYFKMLSAYCNPNLQHHITKESQLVSLDGLIYKTSNAPISYIDCTDLRGRNSNSTH